MATTINDISTITIHACSGGDRFATPINIGSRRVFKLMGDDYITLKFTTAEPVYFQLGDWGEITDDYFGLCKGRYELTTPCVPAYNGACGGYDYELRLDAQHVKWRNKLMKYMPSAGGKECSWSVVADAATHLQMVVDNIMALAEPNGAGGYRNPSYLHDARREWTAARPDNSVTGGVKSISYESTSIYDALSTIAETFECEWWIEGNVIHLGRCDHSGDYLRTDRYDPHGVYVDLELGRNVAEMSRSDSSEKYVSRIYPFGGERNIPATYRKDLIFCVTDVEDGGRLINDRARKLDFTWFADEGFRTAFPTCHNTATHDKAGIPNLHCQWSEVYGLTLQTIDDGGNVTETIENCVLVAPTAEESAPPKAKAARAVSSEQQHYANVGFKLPYGLPSSHNTADAVDYDWRKDVDNPYYRTLSDPTHADYDPCFDPESGEYKSRRDERFGVLYDPAYDSSHDCDGHKDACLDPKSEFYEPRMDESSPLYDPAYNPATDPNNKHGHYNPRVKPQPNDPNYRYWLANNPGGGSADSDDSIADIKVTAAFIRLPEGKSFEVGQKYVIANIPRRRVKSSYFSERAYAYDRFSDIVQNTIAAKRLMLPEAGLPYVDLKSGQTAENSVEDVVVFDDVYPHALCTVTKVTSRVLQEEIENSDGTKTKREYVVYRLQDDTFTSTGEKGKYPFKSIYKSPNGEPLRIWFQDVQRYRQGDDIPKGSYIGDPTPNVPTDAYGVPLGGKLNGQDFDVEFVGELQEAKDEGVVWEIIRKGDTYIPNETILPTVGDQFIITNYDISMVDDVLVAKAEQRLKKVASEYVRKLNQDPSTYECTLMCDSAEASMPLQVGTPVNLVNPTYIETEIETRADGTQRKWGRKSRVIGYEINLDIPYDNPVFTIGEKPQYSRFGQIEDSIEAIRYAVNAGKYAAEGGAGSAGNGGSNGGSSITNDISGNQQTQGGGSSVAVVHLNDSTPASDFNVFSALRSRWEFGSKRMADRITGLWNFENGATFGNYRGIVSGAAITDQGGAVFDSAYVRNDSTFNSAKFRGNVDFGNFVAGASGGRIWTDPSGNVHIETDYIQARKKIQAREVEIQQATHVGGCQILSPAAMRCTRVAEIRGADNSVTAYRCFFSAQADDGTAVYNQFAVDDLARCETFNLVKGADGMVGNRYYWRRVVAVGTTSESDPSYNAAAGAEHYIDLSNVGGGFDAGSCAPMAADRIVVMGNADPAKAERSNLIVLSSYGSGSPYIYQFKGVNSFSLGADRLKTRISPEGNLFTGRLMIESGTTEAVEVTDYIHQQSSLTNSYYIVTTSESVVLSCDSDGVYRGVYPLIGVKVMLGTTESAGWSVAMDCTGCTAELAAGVIALTSVTESTALIGITATKTDCPTLRKVVSVCLVKGGDKGDKGDTGDKGSQGDNAIQFEIVPDANIALIDKDGNVNPAALGCRAYMTDGNKSRTEITLTQDGTQDADPAVRAISDGTTIVAADGSLVAERLNGVPVPRNLSLRYVIASQTFEGATPGSLTMSVEYTYVRPVPMTSDMRNVVFKLYRGTEIVAVKVVDVIMDTRQMDAVYRTRFEQNEKAIMLQAERSDGIESSVGSLEITAAAIRQSVQTLEAETGNLRESVIEQTDRNIQLKVNEVVGYRNLVINNSNGRGWIVAGERSPLMRDGRFVISTAYGAVNWLRTPVFDVAPNTEYTLSFEREKYQKGSGNSFSVFVVDAATHQVVTSRYLATAKESVGFTTGAASGASVYVEFRISAGISSEISLSVWNVQVEKGVEAHPFHDGGLGLLGTGIDIENRKMTMTADNFQIRNNDGTTTLMLDANGKLQASLIDADQIHTNRLIAGDERGQRVSITPESKRVEIYDGGNAVCTVMDGATYAGGADDLFASVQTRPAEAVESDLTQRSFRQCTHRYTAPAEGANIQPHSHRFTLYTKTLRCEYPSELTFDGGSVACTLKSGGFYYHTEHGYVPSRLGAPTNEWFGCNGMNAGLMSYANARLSMIVETSDTDTFASVRRKTYPMAEWNVKQDGWIVDDATGERRNLSETDGTLYVGKSRTFNMPLTGLTYKSDGAKFIRAALVVETDVLMEGSAVDLQWTASAKWTPGLNTSNYFSNGLCIGAQRDQCISIHRDTAGNMNLDAVYRGEGVRIVNGQLTTRSRFGAWHGFPEILCHAVFSVKSEWNAALRKNVMSLVCEAFNTSYGGEVTDANTLADILNQWTTAVTKHRQDVFDPADPYAKTPISSVDYTKVAMTFPANWSVYGLRPSSAIVNVIPYGVTAQSSLLEFNSSRVVFSLRECERFSLTITKI